MKKGNTYLTDDEIDLRDIIKKLWKEKYSKRNQNPQDL